MRKNLGDLLQEKYPAPKFLEKPNFPSGVQRSAYAKTSWHLVPFEACKLISDARRDGEAQGYDMTSWKKGKDDKEFRTDNINHAIDHLADYIETGDRMHLSHALCCLAFEAEYTKESNDPEK